jgi:large subunit ribosomal protein L9
MKVVLRKDVTNVGKKGDIADVSDGFGRNFLIPKGFAFIATDGVVDQAAAMRRGRDVRDAKDRSAAEEIARKLVSAQITVKVKAGAEGRLFGSVTSGDVVEAIASQAKVELDRKTIHLSEAIKSVGSYQIPVKLHSDVQFQVNVEVVAS